MCMVVENSPLGVSVLWTTIFVWGLCLSLPNGLVSARPFRTPWLSEQRSRRVLPFFYPLALDVRGGEGDENDKHIDHEKAAMNLENVFDSTAQTTAPYHLLSILPAQGFSDPQHDWLPAGCSSLTNTSATMLWGNPDLWQPTNLPLVETLALVSDVIVLTVGPPGHGDQPEEVIAPEVGVALERGWQRRLAQGMRPARLWMVRTGDDDVTKESSDNNQQRYDRESSQKDWLDKMVLQEWTSHLSTPSASPTLLQDWQLYQGPAEYAMAIRAFVHEQTAETEYLQLSSIVPIDGIKSLLKRVYTTIGKGQGDDLFLSNTNMQTFSELPHLITDSLSQATIPSPAEAFKAEENDTRNESSQQQQAQEQIEQDSGAWSQLEQVQAQLDDYWLAGSSSGLNLPPDILRLLLRIDLKTILGGDAELQGRLEGVIEQHANILRDYYGRLYESLLEGGRAGGGSVDSLLKQYQSVTKHINSKIGKFSTRIQIMYKVTREGLKEDMAEITDRWQTAADVMFESDDEEQGTPQRRIPLWLRRLAVRALVLGINYFQGWLAWQGIQRAALARERQMPKFPLF